TDARLLVPRPRQDGVARTPVGGRRGPGRPAVGLPRLVGVADDLPDEAPRPRPEAPGRSRLDARPPPPAGPGAAPGRPRGRVPAGALRARRGDLPGGRPRRLA